MISNKTRRAGFTLIELLVVVAMIMLVIAAMGTAVNGAHERARRQKAVFEVKAITQAILAYENETKDGKTHKLTPLNQVDCDKSTLGFLLGHETSESGKVPTMLMAQLAGGGKMLDPWGHPYKVTIKEGVSSLQFNTKLQNLETGYYLPNLDRLREEER